MRFRAHESGQPQEIHASAPQEMAAFVKTEFMKCDKLFNSASVCIE